MNITVAMRGDMMKITNSSIPNNAFVSNSTGNNVEKSKEVLAEIKDENNQTKETMDTLSLSDEAKKILADAEAVKDIAQQLETSTKAELGPLDDLIKCMQIASRIIKGDKVPQADVNFLIEKNPKMYTSAVLMKQENKDPKKHESLLEDEKDNRVGDLLGKVEMNEAITDNNHSTEE